MIKTDDMLDLVYEAQQWDATTGRSDCFGVVLEVWRRMGGKHEDMRNQMLAQYDPSVASQVWLTFHGFFVRVDGALQDGDLLYFADTNHAAVVVGEYGIQATKHHGVFMTRAKGMVRLPGVEVYRLK